MARKGNPISERRKGSMALFKYIMTLLWIWIFSFIFDWGATFLAPFLDSLDFLLSAMNGFPLSVGDGGSDAGPSRPPIPDLNLPPAPAQEQELDLNFPPAPEPEQQPNPYSGLSRTQLKEALKKSIKRVRALRGLKNHWEGEMEGARRMERESRERERLQLLHMQEVIKNFFRGRR